jgi:L-rhamnose mutarotase
MRIAFRMKVNDGKESEYMARHNPIWSELTEVLKAHGVQSYSIFLDRETNDLFAYAEIEDLERWKSVAETEVCKKWWYSMAALMPTNDNKSPMCADLEEVFHIER